MTIHGKNLFFEIADAAAVARNLSAFIRAVSGLPASDSPVVDATAAGSNTRVFKRGIRGSEGSLKGLYDSLATTGPDVVFFGLRGLETPSAFTYGPEGNALGRPKYAGSMWITSYDVSQDYDDMVMFTANFTVEGDVVRGAF